MWIIFHHYKIVILLLSIHMKGGGAINGISSLKYKYYGMIDIFWNIGRYLYFGLASSCVVSKDRDL